MGKDRRGTEGDSWSPAETGAAEGAAPMFRGDVDSGSSAAETAGILAEQARTRAEMERLLKENEELRRGQDRILRLLSDQAGRDRVDLKAAVADVLRQWAPADGPAPAAVVGPVPTLEEMKAVEERVAAMAKAIESVDGRLAEAAAQAQGFSRQVGDIAAAQRDLSAVKDRLDMINAQRAWIDGKIQSLAKQRMVVERAHIEAGKLNALFWEMEEKVRETERQSRIVAKGQGSIEALEGRLRASHEAIQKVERFEAALKGGRRDLDEMTALSAELQEKLGEFQKGKKSIDEFIARARDASATVKSMDASMNTILQHNARLEETRGVIIGFQEQLAAVDKKIDKTRSQWNSVEKLEGKIARLEERVKGFGEDLAKASHLEDSLRKVEEKVAGIRREENELLRAMEALEARREEVRSLGEAADGAREVSEKVLRDMEFLRLRQSEIAGIGERADALDRFLGQVDGRAKEVEGRLGGLADVEARLGRLDDLAADTDRRIRDQLGRQGPLDALRQRLDGLDGQASALESRARDLLAFGDRLRALEGQLGEVDRMGREAEGLLERAGERESSAARQEERFRALADEHRALAAEFGESLARHGQDHKALLSRLAASRDELKAHSAEIEERLRAVGGHNASLKQSEERLRKVDGFLLSLEQGMSALEKRQAEMAAVDGRIQGALKEVADVESRMELLKQEKGVIHDARKSVESLHVMMRTVAEKLEGLKSEEEAVARAQDGVKAIKGALGETEEKLQALARERTVIKEAQEQMQSLRLMVDDLKAQIRTVAEEEARIQEAVDKASELEFLIGGADAAIASLKRLRPKG